MRIFLLIVQVSQGSDPIWANDFVDPNGQTVFSCIGYEDPADSQQLPILSDYLTKYPTFCTCSDLKGAGEGCPDEVYQAFLECGLACRIGCANRKSYPKCFDKTGDLTIGTPQYRSCAFHLRFPFNPASDILYPFPSLSPLGPTSEIIFRTCLHHDYSDDNEKDAVAHPYYYCHNDESCHPRDCINLTIGNIMDYYSDIVYTPGSRSKRDRHFLCTCDYPFTNSTSSPTFQTCVTKVETVFSKLKTFDDLNKCLIANKCNETCAHHYPGHANSELTPICGQLSKSNVAMWLVIVFIMTLSMLFVLFTHRRRNDKRGNLGGHGTDAGATDVTLLTDSIHDPLLKYLKVFEGSIETKAVPYILTKFRRINSNNSLFTNITSSDVLNGRPSVGFLDLDNFLQSHCITKNAPLSEANVIKILLDLSWWINELHGSDHGGQNEWNNEAKTWSIFHGAINPINIRISLTANCTYLMVVNFATAADLLNQQTVNKPCYNEESKSNFHGNYLPPEMLTIPEKSEKRCILSADIYAFACIGWKLLNASVRFSSALEDPFDEEIKRIRQITPTLKDISDCQVLKVLFEDRSLRPSLDFARPKFDRIVDLINDCWVEQPALRLTAAQLFHRVNELSRCSAKS